jgi:hypothetical protein
MKRVNMRERRVTYRRKKWKRSLMSRKDFLPEKNAWRAREISWFEEYLMSRLVRRAREG